MVQCFLIVNCIRNSSPPVDLAFPGALLSDLLSLFVSWIVTHEAEVFQVLSGVDVEGLEGPGESGDDGLDLAIVAAAPDLDLDVEEASVVGEDQREKDPSSLHRQEHGLEDGLVVHDDLASAWFDSHESPRRLSLAKAMSSRL